MKIKFITLLLLLALPFFSFSQAQVVKGRAFLLPKNSVAWYNLGIGYERFMNKAFSLQVHFNRKGKDRRSIGGRISHENELLFELRYYTTSVMPKNNALFIFIFNSRSRINQLVNETDKMNLAINRVYATRNSGGMGMGKSLRIKNNWYLEILGGFKYVAEKEIIQYDASNPNNPIGSIHENDTFELDIRVTFNIAYSF